MYFSKASKLSARLNQLIIKQKIDDSDSWSETSIPFEDIGFVIIDHPQITFTSSVPQHLLKQKSAFITCSKERLPEGLLLPLAGNHIQTERFRFQINASLPLKKQLWQQTVRSKIINQATHLLKRNQNANALVRLAKIVNAGDTINTEAQAAAKYWKLIYANKIESFKRYREGEEPNSILNYGYAILRAVVARSLVISGMLPTLGIHHRNKYNAYCLADDIMEPYRPYVDDLVWDIMQEFPIVDIVIKEIKVKLLNIPAIDVKIDGKVYPLMSAVQRTTASLYRCFCGEQRKILYPTF